jgi:hypothetical protein
MKDDEITALAKGVAPFVRECVSEALKAVDVRLGELETRAPVPGPVGPQGEVGLKGEKGEKGECSADSIMLSAELAQQVASMARLLHESPPIAEGEQKAQPRITRIKRDEQGNFQLVYDEPHA